VVHEWLTTYAGSERVLREILSLFPEADLFAVVDFLSDADRAKLFGDRPPRRARTSFIQRLPFAAKKYRAYLPLMPIAVEQFDLSAYDLVISSNHAVAKGVLTGPDQTHICYCHSPIRYAWDLQHQYLRESGLVRGPKSILARAILHYIRLWDARTANGVDRFVANSAFIARRIRKTYGRPAQVIHPPVDTAAFALRVDKQDFYLTASRLVQYKRIDLIVAAFTTMPDRRLLVLGDGPEMQSLRAAAGPNVTFLGYQSDAVLIDHLQRARAFVFAAEEDFGILPIEAQSCGTPVIAYGRGGVLESVVGLNDDAPPTGVFFPEQTAPAIIAAIHTFEAAESRITPQACRARAETFAIERFRAAFLETTTTAIAAARTGLAA
jgi:glycosyltransferase involved in cell wall biosynthesis